MFYGINGQPIILNDDVYTKLKYDVMPENVWGYTTKYGQITTNNIQKYKVGDSIEIEVISKIK